MPRHEKIVAKIMAEASADAYPVEFPWNVLCHHVPEWGPDHLICSFREEADALNYVERSGTPWLIVEKRPDASL